MSRVVDTPKRRRSADTEIPLTAEGLPVGPITKQQFCKLFHCSPKYMECEVRAGKLRPHKFSHNMVRLMPNSIREWLASKAV